VGVVNFYGQGCCTSLPIFVCGIVEMVGNGYIVYYEYSVHNRWDTTICNSFRCAVVQRVGAYAQSQGGGVV